MAHQVIGSDASHQRGQVTAVTTSPPSAPALPSSNMSSIPSTIPGLIINTGHQPKRLLSPAPIGLPTTSATSSQRASPVPSSGSSQVHPQPNLQQDEAGLLQDDAGPSTPKRPASNLSRGLSLQMPSRDNSDLSGNVIKSDIRTPLTPKLDQNISYATTPASLLPRRSRGMDFSRAATHLHHSTLAGHPDPESSPIVGGRGVSVPRGTRNSLYDSPMRGGNGGPGHDQGAISSSVGSISMADSGSDSSGDDDIAMRDEDEMMHMTPQPNRSMFGTNAALTMHSPGGESLAPFTAASSNFMNYREKLRGRAKRKDSNSTKRSSNGWRFDLFGSPVYGSPPIVRSIENSENYFQRELSRRSIASRRESLSLGTDELAIDDSNNTPGSEDSKGAMETFGISSTNAEVRRNVIKKAVTTRRSHLIPKSKGFARIRAELAEESTPIDIENKREAEVIRQVKEREEHTKPEDQMLLAAPSQPTTTASSPCLAPVTTVNSGTSCDSPQDDMSINIDTEPGSTTANTRRSSSSFSQQASRHGAGSDFWNKFLDDDRLRTPPPPLFRGGSSSMSTMSEDTSMTLETNATGTSIAPPLWPGRESVHMSSPARARSNTPTTVSIKTEWTRNALGKRRRDDELDAEFFKRRAVSPGLSSIAGSPVLPPSPASKEVSWWSMSKGMPDGGSTVGTGATGNGAAATATATATSGKKESSGGRVPGERVGSGSSDNGRANAGSRGVGVERRVGMQGMNEAGEGLMNMSID